MDEKAQCKKLYGRRNNNDDRVAAVMPSFMEKKHGKWRGRLY
jgi:hypothetical protein